MTNDQRHLPPPMKFLAQFLLLSISGITPPLLHSQSSNLKFDHLSVEQGLSQSNAIRIIQDRQGFIWIATWEGMNRYDGYEFKVYRNDPFDSNSLSSNVIQSVELGRDGTLWV